ncbi:hypothetical protein CHARACLAT_028445 [Characodon lateralis]|uniref:Secreted protein n=1 Tax=Characodon lateralis TaxID=208331 RepID=A0ABU7DV32_9TELE|nr:hypothetical protein [Characodon lateralis]
MPSPISSRCLLLILSHYLHIHPYHLRRLSTTVFDWVPQGETQFFAHVQFAKNHLGEKSTDIEINQYSIVC